MSAMERRLQLLLDHERYERVAAAAEKEGISVSAAIRHAIDVTYPDAAIRRGEAMRRFLQMVDEHNAHLDALGIQDVPFDKDALLNDVVDGIDA